jgi:hypothetical protein
MLNDAQTLFDFRKEENEKQTWTGYGFANSKCGTYFSFNY